MQPKRGYTFLELCATLVIIFIAVAILYPVATYCGPSVGKQNQAQCASNLKQIGVAALMYAQDYDGTFPPAVTTEKHPVLPPLRRFGGDGRSKLGPPHFEPFGARFWFGITEFTSNSTMPRLGGGFLQPYQNTQTENLYLCPSGGTVGSASYMANDLIGGAKQTQLTNASNTIVAMDGEGFLNIGHSLVPKNFPIPEPFIALQWDKEKAAIRATASVEEAAYRHSGGACYLFADGHVRWNTPDTVFFPRTPSKNPTHLEPKTGLPIGPNPAGDMWFDRQKYTATFHLR